MMKVSDPKPGDFLNRKRFTANYKPSIIGTFSSWYIDDRPPFTLLEAQRMERDPMINFGLRIIRAPLHTVRWHIHCENKTATEYIRKQLDRIWTSSLRKMLNFLRHGVSVGEVTYKMGREYVEFDRYDDIYPTDVVPLQWATSRRSGEICGYRIRANNYTNVIGTATAATNDVFPPHAFWHAGEAEYGSIWGRPRLVGAYLPWLEKSARHGAEDIRRKWFQKNAFRGPIMWYPVGTTDLGDSESGPVIRSNQEIAREIVEKFMTGGVMALPNIQLPEDGGKAWDYKDSQMNGDIEGILDYPEILDKKILVGLGIPPELVEASTVGSGYNGRSIPAQMFFTSEDELVHGLFTSIDQQIMRWLVKVNFGDVDYEIIPESLAANVSKTPQNVQQQGKDKRAAAAARGPGGGGTGVGISNILEVNEGPDGKKVHVESGGGQPPVQHMQQRRENPAIHLPGVPDESVRKPKPAQKQAKPEDEDQQELKDSGIDKDIDNPEEEDLRVNKTTPEGQ